MSIISFSPSRWKSNFERTEWDFSYYPKLKVKYTKFQLSVLLQHIILTSRTIKKNKKGGKKFIFLRGDRTWILHVPAKNLMRYRRAKEHNIIYYKIILVINLSDLLATRSIFIIFVNSMSNQHFLGKSPFYFGFRQI